MKSLKKSSGWGSASLLRRRLWPEMACVIPGLCSPGMHCKVSKDVTGHLWRLVPVVPQPLPLSPSSPAATCSDGQICSSISHFWLLWSVSTWASVIWGTVYFSLTVRESLKEHLEFIYSDHLLKQGHLEQASQDHLQLVLNIFKDGDSATFWATSVSVWPPSSCCKRETKDHSRLEVKDVGKESGFLW